MQHTSKCQSHALIKQWAAQGGLRRTQWDAREGIVSLQKSSDQPGGASEMSTEGHVIVRRPVSETSHDVMVTRTPWHSLMQHNISTHPQADICPSVPRQLPSHWLNKHSRRDFRDLGKHPRCATIGWSGV